ncbi:putative lipoprotein [Escherichia coli STEC_MHI813]|nr:putative lipoprotein [Escherichia coli STEC_MHI813]
MMNRVLFWVMVFFAIFSGCKFCIMAEPITFYVKKAVFIRIKQRYLRVLAAEKRVNRVI